jgi:HlyD family secretion protein
MRDAPITVSREQRLSDLRRGLLPAVVWTLAAVAAGVMLGSRARSREFVGLAQALRYEVSAPVSGTIVSVPVHELERVEAGDVVAQLDDEALEAQVRTAVTAAGQLSAELEAARSRLTSGGGPLAEGYASDLRRFWLDEQRRGLDALSLEVTVETDQVELERRRLDFERTQKLYDDGLVPEMDRDNAELVMKEVATRIASTQALLDQTRADQQTAQKRREDFERSHPYEPALDAALRPLVEAVNVQHSRLEELRVERKHLTLYSPIAGEVSQVLCRPGQAVVPGEAVVMVTEPIPQEIIAYLPERMAGHVAERTVVTIARRSDPNRAAQSFVTRVGASMETLPAILWRDSNRPEYGLPIAIAATPALKLTPGEVVFVRAGRLGG